ncbi:hypothetical protein [Nitrosospira briensis]|uniref:hypothetical protein n=1 Tax=Nitrosospira briensis TaxID=35799 RepID=UPI0012E0EE01|nr:hypothetical protein [Nitrosospira briensis]
MNTYRIKNGEHFLMDGKTLEGGELIELPADLAEMHKSRIDLVPPEKAGKADAKQA